MSILDKYRKNDVNLDELNDKIKQEAKGKKFEKDTTFYQQKPDSLGNAVSIIRFLPAPEIDGDDATDFVKRFEHGFQGPGGWYIENSLTTLGRADPASEYNTYLWNKGTDDDKKIASYQKRKLKFISNILVIADEAQPEKVGKVFRYKYGVKIFDKRTECMKPQFATDPAFDPFHPFTGANFRLIQVRQGVGKNAFPNFDKSHYEKQSPLAGGKEKEMEEILKQCYSLKELVAESAFKSYDELKKRLDRVLNLSGAIPAAIAKATMEGKSPAKTLEDIQEELSADEQEQLSQFANLAND